MRFLVETRARAVGTGVLLLIRREGDASGHPPELEEEAELVTGREPGRVLAVDGPAAVVLLDGRAWVISPLRPDELSWQRLEWLAGRGAGEWVVRAPFGQA